MQQHFLDLVNVVLVHNVTIQFFHNKGLVLSHTCMFNGYGQVKPESLQVTSQVRTFYRLPKVKSIFSAQHISSKFSDGNMSTLSLQS